MKQVTTVDHPLVQHHLGRLRQADTPPPEFRQLVGRLAVLLAYEATKDLPLEDYSLATPLTETTGRRVVGRVGLVPILRAGLGMVAPVLDLLPARDAGRNDPGFGGSGLDGRKQPPFPHRQRL